MVVTVAMRVAPMPRRIKFRPPGVKRDFLVGLAFDEFLDSVEIDFGEFETVES